MKPKTNTRKANADRLRGTIGIRTLPTSRMECRTANGTITFQGLASSTEHSYDMGSYREVVKAGAFTRTLAQPDLDVQLRIEHAGLPLARTTNGSLTLMETNRGLEFTATAPADDPDAAQVARKLKSGLMSEASFAFKVVRQTWDEAYENRTILAVDLHRGDVSICALGANPNTLVTARALAARRARLRNGDLYQARLRAMKLRGR
jgi:HK97 family phage prohead protease